MLPGAGAVFWEISTESPSSLSLFHSLLVGFEQLPWMLYFFRGCPTKNTMDFQLDGIGCVGPRCPVPGSDDQGAVVAFVLLGLVFCPLFPGTEWMLNGSGSRPRAFCLSPEVLLDSICGEMSRITLVQPDFHGQSVLVLKWCNWSVQCSCTEGKKSCLHKWNQPRLATAYIKTNKKNKKPNWLMLIQQCSDSTITLQEMRQRRSGLCHSFVLLWQKPTWKQEAFSQRELPPAAFTCTSTLLENHLQWCSISNAMTCTCFMLCSEYKSCVCRQLRWPDCTRIIRFINGGLKSRLHGSKRACKQLNVGNSKVVFQQGDGGRMIAG